MILPLFIAADTLLVRQVPPARTGFEQTVFVAAGLAQIVTLVVVVLLAMIFFRMWKAQQAIQQEIGRLSAKVDPMIASGTAAAENVRALTDTVRRDAAQAAQALTEATSRVRDSVAGIADRIDDVGTMIGRVQEKADTVIAVASAALGAVEVAARRKRQRARRARAAGSVTRTDGDANPAPPGDDPAAPR